MLARRRTLAALSIAWLFATALPIAATRPASGAPAPAWTLTITPALIDLSQTTVLNVSGGGNPLQYSYNWSGLPSGCVSENVSRLSCFPSANGTFSVSVDVTPTTGPTSRVGPATLTVHSWPESNDLRTSPGTGVAPLTVSFTDTATGGTPPYTWIWWFGDSVVSHQENASHTYTTPGTYAAVGYAIDSLGVGAGVGWRILVYAPLAVGLIAAPSSLTVGQNLTLTATVSEGNPNYTYAWAGLPPGCLPANLSAIVCMPDAAGTYHVQVTVLDASGQVRTATVDVQVQIAPNSYLSPGTDPAFLLVVAGFVVAGICGLLLLLLRLRRRPPPTLPVDAPPPPR